MKTQLKPIARSCFLTTALLMSALFTANAFAGSSCSALKLIESRNTGVSVSQNGCDDKSELAVGAKLEIGAGSRLWLQFNDEVDSGYQLICQNRSSSPVNLEVTSAESPWVTPQGAECKKWTNNRLTCDDKGQKNSFFCAIAEAKQANSKEAIELGTSVKFRVIETPQNKIISNVSKEIVLCKNLYGVKKKLNVSWTVSDSGSIKDLSVADKNPDLASCIEKVVTGVIYDKPTDGNAELAINHAF